MNVRDFNKKHAELALDYCIKVFGTYAHKNPPQIRVREFTRGKDYGEFHLHLNKIVIFKSWHKTYVDLMDTIIHEYTHYLQNQTRYKTSARLYGYNDNPYELQAEQIAKEHKWACKRYVSSQLKSK